MNDPIAREVVESGQPALVMDMVELAANRLVAGAPNAVLGPKPHSTD